MYKININEWIVKKPDGIEGKESLLMVLGLLVGQKKADEMPRGFAQFQLFNKLVKSFDKAEQSKVLELEEPVYKFLRTTIEKDIPANWAGNKNIVEAIETFMNTRDE